MFSKSGLRRKSREWHSARRYFLVLLAAACVSSASLRPADKLQELQERFDHETHAGGKVKELQKLGPAQFDVASKAGAAGDFVTVGLTWEKYRDNVRVAFDLLRKQEPDADRHPGNYRQLELGLRRGIRELEDTVLVAPEEVKPPLEIVHKDLLDTDDALIALLFPRRTKDPMKVPPPPAEPKP